MSGSTWGGVIGGAIGFWVGGPEGARWGWMIGSAIGGAVDPEHIRAPGIGDAQRQTSQAGIPIPKIYGKPQPIKGNLIDGETIARKIIVEEQQGKGGGPVVESERFLLTYAVGICEGPIAGIQRLRRNGEIVYDRSVDSEFPVFSDGDAESRTLYIKATRAKTSAWSGKIRVYLGTETQLPDPSLEAIHGVGNTPYYRGVAYFIVIDDDVTHTRGAASIWDIEPVSVGSEVTIDTGGGLAPGEYSQFQNAHWPLSGTEDQYTYTGTWTAGDGTGVTSATFDTIAEVKEYFAGVNALDGTATANTLGVPSYYVGYIADTANDAGPHTDSTKKFDVVAAQQDVTNLESVVLLYQWFLPELGWFQAAPNDACPLLSTGGPMIGTGNGMVVRRRSGDYPNEWVGIEACGFFASDGAIEGIYPLCIEVHRKRLAPQPTGLPVPDADGYYADTLEVNPYIEYESVTGTFKLLATAQVTGADPDRTYSHYEVGPVLPLGHADYNNATYWTAAYDAAVVAGDLPAGWTYGVEYPTTTGQVWQAPASTFTTLEANDVTLQSVIEDLASRANLPLERIDASELTDIIPGYLVATGGTVADCIRPLQQPFIFDTPEIDGQIVCRKRGGATAFTVTDDDLLEMTDEDVRTTPQPVEYPKKIHFVVPDPDANYTPTPQTFERYTPDVKAVGEVTVAAPIPFRADEAKQRVEVMGKVAWARAEGTIEIPLPEEYSQYVPSDCFAYSGRRWMIEEARYSDGTVRVKAVYDRLTNYTSTATGVAPTTPNRPGSGVLGPTQMHILNISMLRDTDDKLGFYVVVSGLLPDWPGCLIQVSPDGGATWTTGPTITTASVMGTITTELADAHSHTVDENNTFGVAVNGTMSSVTSDQFMQGFNVAIIGDSTTQEIVHFQTAADLGDDEYTCSRLLRGRKNTEPSYHHAGERFAMLNNATFVEAPSSWLGLTLKVRAVTLGTVAEANTSQDFMFSPAYSQREWGPVMFQGTRDASNNITISCVTRGRRGSSALPADSTYADGYQVRLTKEAVQKVYRTYAFPFLYPASQQTADFGTATGTLAVDIEPMNRLTGIGQYLKGSID